MALVFVPGVVFWLAVAWYADRKLTRARRREAGRCEGCGYDLHALESTSCPECGESVSGA